MEEQKPEEPMKANKTVSQTIVGVMHADNSKFPIRLVASSLLLVAGLGLVVFHSIMHEDEGFAIEAWILIALGGGNLGIQGAGNLLKKFTG